MASARSKSKAKKRRDPLPERFASLAEAAEFWDTHDSADYEEYMEDVECEVDIQRQTFLISLDSDLYRKVSAIAQSRGISTETLINLWLQEKAA
jgi:hypothetical protein